MEIPQFDFRKSIATATLAGSVLLGSLGVSVVTVALPSLSSAFSEPLATVQWVVVAYLLAATVTVVLAGKLGDLLGHRRVLLGGLVVFSTASVLCAFAPTLLALAAARALQGVGAAVLMALPMSILKETVGKDRLGSAMGLMGTMSAVGTALGPSLGGFVLSAFGWRFLFAPMAAIGIVVLVMSVVALPVKREPPHGPVRLDWFGAFLLAVALACYSLSMSRSGADYQVMFLVSAMATLAAFIAVEIRSASPLVPIAALRNRVTATALATNLVMSTVMMATLVVGPFYLSLSLGLDDRMVGLVMSVGPITSALSGVLAGRAVDRFGAKVVMAAGLLEAAIGFTLLAILSRHVGLSGYVASLVVLTPGFQMFLAANGAALMASAPDNQRGMLSGLLGLSRNLGFVTGATAMATLFTLAVGANDVLHASESAVASGFSTTFLTAAGLSLFALVVATITQRRAGDGSATPHKHSGAQST